MNIIEKIKKQEVIIKLIFIFLSIISMSSVLYEKIGILYKFSTISIIILYGIFIYKGNIIVKKYMILFILLFTTQLLSSIINFNNNFIGNNIELLFMMAYCLIGIIGIGENLEKIFNIVSYIVQIISFLTAILGFILFFLKINIIVYLTETKYLSYGLNLGRFWGLINPNATAIFCYISICLAILLIYKKSRYIFLLKINIILQIIYFAIQQSRGAFLSVLVMIFIYIIFSDINLKKKIVSLLFSFIFISGASLITTYCISEYVSNSDVSVYQFGKNLNIINKEDKKEKGEIRLTESTSSGRIEIWKGALKMGMESPILGQGIRNVPSKYEKFFSAYIIENSLKGGNFHNIFITTFVATGILGVLSFIILLSTMFLDFFKYLMKGASSKYNRVLLLIPIGIVFGQLFESTILYSTNFVNIFFWLTMGYCCYLIEKDKFSKYEPVTEIKEIQEKQLHILDYIHDICEKQNLTYFLAYGTLIGAVRHKGFIPWDDDIDICMPRDDYEKLQNYLISHSNLEFEVMSYLNNKNYVYPFMKVIDKNTYLLEEDVRVDSGMGIYIDIFPIDGHNDNSELRNKMTLLIKKRQLSCYTFKGITNKKSLLDSIVRYVFIILFYFSSTRKYVKRIDELAKERKIENCEYADYVIYKDMKSPNIRKEWFSETINVEFCGRMYKAPKNYHEILTADYGDYMQLPPVEKRVTHHSFNAWKKKERL